MTWWATDRAGNASARGAATIKVDRTPPETVAFEAPDPADPTRVSVVASDATSGVAGGRVELRRTGAATWSRLPSSLDRGRVVARVDDATLRAGAYELRAVVSDAAGNEAIGTTRADGAPGHGHAPAPPHDHRALVRRGRSLRGRLTAGGKPLAGRELLLTQRLRGRRGWHPVCGRRTVIVARTSRAPPPAPPLAPRPARPPGPRRAARSARTARAASGSGSPRARRARSGSPSRATRSSCPRTAAPASARRRAAGSTPTRAPSPRAASSASPVTSSAATSPSRARSSSSRPASARAGGPSRPSARTAAATSATSTASAPRPPARPTGSACASAPRPPTPFERGTARPIPIHVR